MYDETSNYQLRINTCYDMLIFAGMGVRDYCDGETFEAKCKQNEVIVMKPALYGRMRAQSRCVRDNVGYIGCKENVTDQVNRHCSGRNECRLEVTANLFEVSNPCLEDAEPYLETGYTCMKSKFWFNLILRNVWKV